MPVEKRTYSVLIVSGKKSSCDFITAMLQPFSYKPIYTADSAAAAKRAILNNQYNIIIVDSPLPDEFGHDFAADIAATTASSVMLLVKNEIYDRACAKVEDYGVLTVAKPVTKQEFYHAIKFVTAASARLVNEEKKTQKLEDKIEEIRIINRAKCYLIEKQGMSEPEAHRYIEKNAMDNRLSKKEVAIRILAE